jgi:hypothetical protein
LEDEQSRARCTKEEMTVDRINSLLAILEDEGEARSPRGGYFY